jgi:diguanylate cyclase (GGDEF)-like protein
MPDLSALHTLVINSLEEHIAVIDRAGTIIDVNSAWTRFGVENGLSLKSAWVGLNYLNALSASAASGDAHASEAAKGILEVIRGKRTSFYLEYPCHSPNVQRWFMMRIIGLNDDSRTLFAISHHDITLRKLAEERAKHMAMHDPLTGLANRRYFNLVVNRELRRSIRDSKEISLIAVDVDHFKEYNDDLGHHAGDECLIKVGRVLMVFSRRPGDLAARLGGDEFALLLGDTGFEDSQCIADKIVRRVSDLRSFSVDRSG